MLLIAIPLVWLAVTAIVVAACRVAAMGDRAAEQPVLITGARTPSARFLPRTRGDLRAHARRERPRHFGGRRTHVF